VSVSFRLRSSPVLMLSVALAGLGACQKPAPQKASDKPKAVVVKKSPAELRQLADSAGQSLEGLKPRLAELTEKYRALHVLFDPLPPDMPDFGPTREKFNGADEGVGRMNAKVAWLTGRIDAAIKAGDQAELEELSQSIANTYQDVPVASKIAIELIHEVAPFTRLAQQYEASKRGLCDSDQIGAEAASKKSSVR